MVFRKDDWEKTRGPRDCLNEAELAVVRRAYETGRCQRDVARELKCASRTIQRQYRLLREADDLDIQKRTRFDPVAHRQSRFYRSSFEL